MKALGEKHFFNEEKIAFETADTIEKDLRKQYRAVAVKTRCTCKIDGVGEG